MRVVVCVLVLLAMSACASSSKKKPTLHLGTASKDVTISCRMGWSECDKKARDYCGGEYTEVRGFGKSGPTTVGGNNARTEEIYRRATSSARTKLSMTIRCK